MKRLLSQNKLKRVNTLLRKSNYGLPVFTWLGSLLKTLQSNIDHEALVIQRFDDQSTSTQNHYDSNHFRNGKIELADEDFLELLPANGYIH